MRNSRKQLIAQINLAEIELYKQKKQANLYKTKLSKNIVPILSLAFIIATLAFLFKSKNSVRKIGAIVINAGEIALLNYFKKQITRFLLPN